MDETEITVDDIDTVLKDIIEGKYDVQPRPCLKCGKCHFPSYGAHLDECDECFFSRFPKEEREDFYRNFF